MKTIHNYLVKFGLAFAIILSSCSTIKPVLTKNTKQNSYIIINNPTYSKREMTTFSMIMFPVTVIPAAIYGYKNGKETAPPDLEKESANGGALIGILGGTAGWFLGNWITTAIFGPRKKASPTNEYEASEWLKKYNKKNNQDLIQVSFNNGILTTLSPKSENTFIAYSLVDFKNYIKIFPNSLYTPRVFKSVLSHLYYNEILEIMSLYPNNCCLEEAQGELLKKCTTINECIYIATKYPRLFDLADEKSASLATNMQDVISHNNYFKESSNLAKLISNVIPYLSRRELYDLYVLYPNIATIDQAKIKLINESRSFEETLNTINRFSNYKQYGEETLLKYTKTLDQKRIFSLKYPNNELAIDFQKQANKAIAEKLLRYCFNYIYLIKEEGTQLFDFWDDSNIGDIKNGKRLSYVLYNDNDLIFQLSDGMHGQHFKLEHNNEATEVFEADYGFLAVQSAGLLNYGNDVNTNKAVATVIFNDELKNQNWSDNKKIIILRIGEFDQFGRINGEFKSDNHEIFLYVDGEVSPNVYKKINSILKSQNNFESEFDWFLQSTSKLSPYLTIAQKEFIEGEIFDLSGLEVDISNANQEYTRFTNPNRLLNDYEINSGYMKFPDVTRRMKLGEILEIFTEKIKPICNNTKYCEIAAKNMFYTLLATNAIKASKNLPYSERLKILKLGLYISELYKKDIRNQSISLYEQMINEVDKSIYGIRNNKTDYSRYHNPTVDFVLSLSKGETVAILAGLVGIGASISLSWAQQLCKNTDCSQLSYSASNSSTRLPQQSSNSKTSSVSNVKRDEIIKDNNGPQIIEDGTKKYGSYTTIRYKVICPNGYVSYLFYDEQSKCWMKTSSSTCDYSTPNNKEGLNRAARMLCGNH